jgi:hypothetical protein
MALERSPDRLEHLSMYRQRCSIRPEELSKKSAIPCPGPDGSPVRLRSRRRFSGIPRRGCRFGRSTFCDRPADRECVADRGRELRVLGVRLDAEGVQRLAEEASRRGGEHDVEDVRICEPK